VPYVTTGGLLLDNAGLQFNGTTFALTVPMTTSGNLTQTGSTTLSTGTGAISLNGAVICASTCVVTTRASIGTTLASLAALNIGTPSDISGATQVGVYLNNFAGSAAATTGLRGVQSQIGTAAAAYTCPLVLSFYANAISLGATSTITRAIGISVGPNTVAATANVGYYYGTAHTPSGTWAAYFQSADNNYLGTGATLINTTTDDATNKLQVNGGIRTLGTTEATSTTVAALLSDGGLGIVKRSYLGTIGATFKGNVLAGVQDGTAAVTGQVGEEIKSTVSGVAVAATTTVGNITSISLTAGDWLLSGYCVISGGATGLTVSTTAKMSIVSTSATNGTSGDTLVQQSVLVLLANGLFTMAIPAKRISVSSTTTYYLTEEVTFAAGSPTVAATLTATRVR
jgi:hypothetical protein